MVSAGYAFRSMSADNRPMVRRWLSVTHVAEWWGDPDKQFALVREDLGHPSMDQFIVALDDRPFASHDCSALLMVCDA